MMNVCIHFMCLQKICVLFGQRLGREERWGKKRKEDIARVQETHSSHLLPSIPIHEEAVITYNCFS